MKRKTRKTKHFKRETITGWQLTWHLSQEPAQNGYTFFSVYVFLLKTKGQKWTNQNQTTKNQKNEKRKTKTKAHSQLRWHLSEKKPSDGYSKGTGPRTGHSQIGGRAPLKGRASHPWRAGWLGALAACEPLPLISTTAFVNQISWSKKGVLPTLQKGPAALLQRVLSFVALKSIPLLYMSRPGWPASTSPVLLGRGSSRHQWVPFMFWLIRFFSVLNRTFLTCMCFEVASIWLSILHRAETTWILSFKVFDLSAKLL